MNEFTEYDALLKFIEENNFTKINIIGCPASGKTTLTEKLGTDLRLPTYDLDDFLYNKHCKRKILEDDKIAISDILKKEKFIIDGTYSSSLTFRINDVDVFVVIQSYKWKCFIRFLKRALLKHNLKCGERITQKTLSLIVNYDKILSNRILPSLPINKIIQFLN